MQDFWAFRRMITPVIIQILFWIGIAVCVIGGIVAIIAGAAGGRALFALQGLMTLILGPIAVRVYLELIIVMFRINETLTDIKNIVGRTPQQ